MARLPDWLEPLFEAAEMRAADAWAIEQDGVRSLDLMERAGTGLARAAERLARPGVIRIVTGKGNNGGDGLVAARLLRADGRQVDVLTAASLDELQGDARTNLDRLPGSPPARFDPEGLEGSGLVIDALLGTGFSGEPREPASSAIAAMNAQAAPVLACDVPSGVDATSGEVGGEAVIATATATFHGAKIGLHVGPGAFHAGEVEVVDIGIARGAPRPARAGLICERILDLYPRRRREGSKFTAGTVIVAGGARGLTGAPTMAALAAQRAGAGYVQAAVPESTETVFELRLLEAMSRGLPDENGSHTPAGVEPLAELAQRAGTVILGPGLGRAEPARAFARQAALAIDRPMLIDADGLNAHAGRLESLAGRSAPTVLTPHAGELARLLGTKSEDIGAHRLARAREAAERSGAVVLLKGNDTIVAAPGGPVAISPGGTPALATAGTGDVLSGVIGALLAKGMDPFPATALGALAHVLAGEAAAEWRGADHVVAGDVVEALPRAFAR